MGKINIKELPSYFLLLFIFFLPIDFHISSIVLFGYLLVVFDLDKSKISFFKYYLPFFLIWLIYLYHIWNLDDSSLGLNIWYLFVLLFLFLKLNEIWFRRYLMALVYGCLFAWVYCMIYPFIYSFSFQLGSFSYLNNSSIVFHSVKNNYLNYFISQQFTKTVMDRAYFALFFNMALIILHNTNFFKSKQKWILTIIFCIAIMQSYSFMGYIEFFIISIIYIIFKLFKITKRWNYSYIMIPFIFIILGGIIYQNKTQNSEIDIPVDNSTSELSRFDYRKLLWSNAGELIKNSGPLGYGVTQTQHKMDSLILKKTHWDEYWIKEKNVYNTHNQYYQYLLEIGYLGLFLFITSMFLLVNSSKNSQYKNLIFLFIVLILMASITESIFKRYVGIGLFIFLYSLFLKNVLNEDR